MNDVPLPVSVTVTFAVPAPLSLALVITGATLSKNTTSLTTGDMFSAASLMNAYLVLFPCVLIV